MQETRMYFFVMYSLSGIQKGIQAGHAAVEYGLKYGETKEYNDFAVHHKTFIVLDGGGSEDMKDRVKELESYDIKHACFHEPDLNNSMSAIAFIIPESIYGMKIDPMNIFDFITPNRDLMVNQWLKSFKLASN